MCVVKVAQSRPTLCDPIDCRPPRLSAHGDSPGKNTGVGCHALIQGVFLDQGFLGGSDCKESACNVGDPGKGNGNPLQYFCLEKSRECRSLVSYTVHRVRKSQTRLSNFTLLYCVLEVKVFFGACFCIQISSCSSTIS